LEAVDRFQANVPVAVPVGGPARRFLTQASYEEAVCWIGECLADALHYAHERKLNHMDLKPSNVLLAGDGQPMILDFHLAREPIETGGPAPEWLGGTPGYMAPEHEAALAAVRAGWPIPAAVGGRADIYALGVLLHEALSGKAPEPLHPTLRRLEHCNPAVTTGLADIVAKCLAAEPQERYPDAATLAADLRRQRLHLPLRGIANRSLSERWQKWRRRRPHALPLLTMLGVIVLTAVLIGVVALTNISQHQREAQQALTEGQQHFDEGRYAEAAQSLRRGLAAARNLPVHGELKQRLNQRYHLARRAQLAQELHALADRMRFCYGAEMRSAAEMQHLAARCQTIWDSRGRLTDRSDAPLETHLEERLATDLLDLAVLWADLRVRSAPTTDAQCARQESLRVLAEAESMFGSSPVLCRQRQAYGEALGQTPNDDIDQCGRSNSEPRTAWEYYAVGRFQLGAGELELATQAFDRAIDLKPQEFWPHFYQGICSYRRGDYEAAANAFQVCVALAPKSAECFYNRALAHAASGQTTFALRDYDKALALDPRLAPAALNRGILHYREGRLEQARTDLDRAMQLGAEPAVCHYNLALILFAQTDLAAARGHQRWLLEHAPSHPLSQELNEHLVNSP
jgi:tetratricopeptide (TPR) repeat protein